MVRRGPARIALLATAVALVLAPAATAGVATSDGGTARFTDPSGVPDRLAADLELVDEAPNVDPQGWSVSFLQDPGTTWGAGCQEGFVGTLCPFGASPPAAIAIELGGGDDDLDFGLKAPAAPTTIAIAGGPGADRIRTVRTRAEIDGGDGDDVIAPDDRWALDFPPDATPGGVIRGGPGADTVDYEQALDPIDVSLDGVADDGRRGEGDNVHPDVEHIAGSTFGGTLVGSAAANHITGGDAPDRLVGGAGRDALAGGAGADTIDALDGRGRDRVACDDGDDVALVDAGDLVAACERVTWAPGLGASTLRYRGGRVAVALACPRAARRCRGALRLVSARGKRATLARAGYRVERGRRATLRIAPTRAGRKALERGSARAIAIVQPAGATTDSGRSVTIRR